MFSLASDSTPPPLGARLTQTGCIFAVSTSPSTASVEVCLHADHSSVIGAETATALTHRLGNIWWRHVDGVKAGDRYGFRMTGPGQLRSKLLGDPYARAIEGVVDWTGAAGALKPNDPRDSAPFVPKSVVVDESFDWGTDASPNVPWSQTIIYEAHVKGATKLLDAVPEDLRGTYAGLAHPGFIEHLHRLGVTSLELLPIHQIGTEEHLARNGLVNYWGYNTLGFFAPHDAYSASGTRGEQVAECKGMIKLLHAEGIEVLLDVVYNHTAEAGPDGPALSFRGTDPQGWYRREDTTGCGNTLNLDDPLALRLVLDSLRYWVEEFHVDGFRFDLATALARGRDGFSDRARFFAAMAQDPVISRVKLIAEPWDVGIGGYRVGGFPAPWAEWNDRFRDTVRDFWGDAPGPQGEVAQRITGSADLFWRSHRAPWTSINFVTAHDGFTLADLVSYNAKHNELNGENNRDGTDNNRSWNGGIEGPTDDETIRAHRKRQQRNFLAMLLLSQGTPMLVAGDELGRSQVGNNNAYCQDNEMSWIDWKAADDDLIYFTARCIALRKQFGILRSPTWLQPEDAAWFAPDGTSMTSGRWDSTSSEGLTLLLDSESVRLALVLNEGASEVDFHIAEGGPWTVELSTDPAIEEGAVMDPTFTVPGSTLLVVSCPVLP